MTPRRGSREVRRVLALLAVPAVLMLSACTDNMSDLRHYVQQVKARPGGRIDPIPDMKPFATYEYPDKTQRDPFAVLSFAKPQPASQVASNGPRPDPTRPREALEEFTLDSLSYVGTLERNGQTWGLVKDPGGTIHRVQSGNYMGKNYGRILSITPTSIEVRELVPSQSGGWIERSASLALNN